MIEEVERMEMGCVRGMVEGVQSTCTDAKVRDRVGEEMQYLVGESMGSKRVGLGLVLISILEI